MAVPAFKDQDSFESGKAIAMFSRKSKFGSFEPLEFKKLFAADLGFAAPMEAPTLLPSGTAQVGGLVDAGDWPDLCPTSSTPAVNVAGLIDMGVPDLCPDVRDARAKSGSFRNEHDTNGLVPTIGAGSGVRDVAVDRAMAAGFRIKHDTNPFRLEHDTNPVHAYRLLSVEEIDDI